LASASRERNSANCPSATVIDNTPTTRRFSTSASVLHTGHENATLRSWVAVLTKTFDRCTSRIGSMSFVSGGSAPRPLK
jgi:hypothetical protein